MIDFRYNIYPSQRPVCRATKRLPPSSIGAFTNEVAPDTMYFYRVNDEDAAGRESKRNIIPLAPGGEVSAVAKATCQEVVTYKHSTCVIESLSKNIFLREIFSFDEESSGSVTFNTPLIRAPGYSFALSIHCCKLGKQMIYTCSCVPLQIQFARKSLCSSRALY